MTTKTVVSATSKKVVLKLAEGSQTVPTVLKTVTADKAFALGQSVAKLCEQQIETVHLVTEEDLEQEEVAGE